MPVRFRAHLASPVRRNYFETMKILLLIGILVWQTNAFAQGSLIYRNGADVLSGAEVDLNLDGTSDFGFMRTGVALGNEFIAFHELAPRSNPNLWPEFAGEVMKGSSQPVEINWSAGQPILADPGPGAEWTTTALNMQYMLVAVRLKDGEDWNYGWMRFEKVGEDALGDLWGLRDAAYNSIPNAPINMLQVPEPSAIVLLMAGGIGLWALTKRRRGLNT